MTPIPFTRSMRSAHTARIVLIAMLLGTAVADPLQGSAADHEASTSESPHMVITLHANPGVHSEPPHLHYALDFTTSVEGNATHREVRAPMPENARLQSFDLTNETRFATPATRTETDVNGTWAIATWGDKGPDVGNKTAMRLEARHEIDLEQELPVRWDRLPEDLSSVRLRLPSSHTPVVDPAYEIQRRGSDAGLTQWNLAMPPGREVELVIRPLDDVQDPGLAAPPPGWSAYAVFAALALLSAGAWFLGKKAESRRKNREEEPPSE